MNKWGMTLIELMIVVALLGIILPTVDFAYKGVIRSVRHKSEKLEQSQRLMKFYTKIKEVAAASGGIVMADERMVTFVNGSVIELFEHGRCVKVNHEVFDFDGSVKVWGFERYGDKSFIMDFMIKDHRFDVVWRLD
jgi:prepilin-type N-terminal cleavage/methylation domain-containing protein